MKKQLLTLASLALTGIGAMAQNYYAVKQIGAPADYSLNYSTGVTSIMAPGSAVTVTDSLSKSLALPFNFTFYGVQYTHFKVSSSGYITFDTVQTVNQNSNIAIPSASAPRAAIFAFWDNHNFKNLVSGGSTFASDVRSYTIGTAPNRKYVISWRLAQGGTVGATNVTYFSLRLLEGSNEFEVIHDYGFGSFTATVGCQNADGTVGKQLSGSPNRNFGGPNGSYDAKLSDVYPFKFGTQLSYDMTTTNVKIPSFVKSNTVYNLDYTLTNNGSENITSFRMNFLATDGTVKSQNVTGVNVENSGGLYNSIHSEGLSFASTGAKVVKVWADQLNGSNNDQMNSNDTLTASTNVMGSSVPKNILHEVFTSSTCPPCKPGNEVLQEVFQQRGGYTVIKYQYNFPGTGDPYYTLEAQSRGAYYGGINSVPRLMVDGQWNDNPNGYTTSIFDGFVEEGFVDINASQTIDAAAKKFTITAKVKPTGSIGGNYKIYMAILERETTKNKKSNGETEFYWVMKKMLPSVGGSPITLTSTDEQVITQSFTFPGAYRLPTSAVTSGGAYNGINLTTEHTVEDFNDLMGVVFIQNETDKTVVQSAWTTPNWMASTKEIKMADLGLTIYPNPAVTNFTVQSERVMNNAKITVYGIDGRVVHTQVLSGMESVIECSSLSNGVYYVEITNDGASATQKLVIAK
jgi:hypothetical protein